MKYLSLLPLAGLALAAPSGWEDKDPAKETTTTVAPTSTWEDNVAVITSKVTASVTYCSKTNQLTKDAPAGGKCTLDVTTITKATATQTVTVTETDKGSWPTGKPDHGKCLSDDDAEAIVANFINLLEFTSYNGSRGGPVGRGYNQAVSDKTLAVDFVDISDSINFMAGKPLGSVTFPNKKAFDMGQGQLQPEVKVDTLNIFHDCKNITWRYKITPVTQVGPYPVIGINYMMINDDGLIQKNYVEFNNGAWLQSLGQKCAVAPISIAPSNALRV
jgi:hypothetical protein